MSFHMKKSVVIDLINHGETSTDDWGNPVNTEERWQVFAEQMSVGQNEFYRAANQGLKPNFVFEIYSEEFKDADLLICDGVEYTIIRTYQRTLDKLELVCERKVANVD